MTVQQVSDSELALMKIIWEKGGTALYVEISEALSASGNLWQKNTIITLLSRLAEKGILTTNKIGHKNRYTALVSESDYQAEQTKTLMEKLYEGSAKGLVTTLIQKEMISAADFEEVRKYWNGGDGK